jgi:hypothetical protein
MADNLEFFDASGTAVAAGVFIPISDLPGVLSTELASGEAANKKKIRFLYGACKAIRNSVTASSWLLNQTANSGNILGSTFTTTEVNGGVGLKNITFTSTTTFISNKGDSTLSLIPLNLTSDGALLVTDIFPNAVKVAAAGAVAEAGVLIPSADLVGFGGIAHNSLTLATSDGRKWLSSLMSYLFENLVLQTASVASALLTKSRTLGQLDIPTSATQATSPTTGLSSSSLNLYTAITDSLAFTIQIIINNDDTVDVNHVVSA